MVIVSVMCRRPVLRGSDAKIFRVRTSLVRQFVALSLPLYSPPLQGPTNERFDIDLRMMMRQSIACVRTDTKLYCTNMASCYLAILF